MAVPCPPASGRCRPGHRPPVGQHTPHPLDPRLPQGAPHQPIPHLRALGLKWAPSIATPFLSLHHFSSSSSKVEPPPRTPTSSSSRRCRSKPRLAALPLRPHCSSPSTVGAAIARCFFNWSRPSRLSLSRRAVGATRAATDRRASSPPLE
jgi:hypothetical protein